MISHVSRIAFRAIFRGIRGFAGFLHRGLADFEDFMVIAVLSHRNSHIFEDFTILQDFRIAFRAIPEECVVLQVFRIAAWPISRI
jgi:hypothetical protein